MRCGHKQWRPCVAAAMGLERSVRIVRIGVITGRIVGWVQGLGMWLWMHAAGVLKEQQWPV